MASTLCERLCRSLENFSICSMTPFRDLRRGAPVGCASWHCGGEGLLWLEDREQSGQGSAGGCDSGDRYLVCEVALVTASISWSFSRFSRWSCSSWSLRISWTDDLQGTEEGAREGLLQTAAPCGGHHGKDLAVGLSWGIPLTALTTGMGYIWGSWC